MPVSDLEELHREMCGVPTPGLAYATGLSARLGQRDEVRDRVHLLLGMRDQGQRAPGRQADGLEVPAPGRRAGS